MRPQKTLSLVKILYRKKKNWKIFYNLTGLTLCPISIEIPLPQADSEKSECSTKSFCEWGWVVVKSCQVSEKIFMKRSPWRAKKLMVKERRL